ncbi:MAG TPA: hypothetical protein VNL92_07655, partial [Dehalococcoidia bacterium]|nr:hypothetical protein [Dehalococcoidia bacterium]
MSRESLRRWRGQAWSAALILSGASIALGILAARYDRFPLDSWLTNRVGRIGAWFEQPAEAACALATPVAIFAGVAGAAFAVARRHGELAALFGSLLIVRPLLSLARLPIERPRVSDPQDLLSFPSGHVMTAALPLGFWLVFGGALVSARTATLI